MNIETGEIKNFNSLDELKKFLENTNEMQEKLIEIEEQDMTEKQKKNKKVLLKDHKSKLGKLLTEERKKQGYSFMSKNQKRKLRRKLNK